MRALMLAVVGLSIAATGSAALPEFAVEAGRACNTCHVAPEYWKNPDTALRKCTLNCNACHVNPTGGGPRTEAGDFYGSHYLGLLKWGRTNTGPAPGPLPPPGTRERFDGIQPHPRVELGFDLRALGYFPEDPAEDDAFFPMQADFHVIARPYDPVEQNVGRLTFVVTAGAEGKRDKADDEDVTDYLFVKEWWVLYHDLPQQAYIKAGRFLPPFGWRFDDHTAFIRQGLSFDNERQVTGVEVGLNPNYPYLHAAVFSSEHDGHSQVPDDGRGVAFSAGYRDLEWQLGGSFLYETRDDANEVWGGANWALSLFSPTHPWKGLRLAPVVYLGELDLRRSSPHPSSSRESTGLAALHEVVWMPRPWLRVASRYEWQDLDLGIRDDHQHRYTEALTVHLVPQLEVSAQYRFNDEPSRTENDEFLLMIHLWR